jgi:hypothetical protein
MVRQLAIGGPLKILRQNQIAYAPQRSFLTDAYSASARSTRSRSQSGSSADPATTFTGAVNAADAR